MSGLDLLGRRAVGGVDWKQGVGQGAELLKRLGGSFSKADAVAPAAAAAEAGARAREEALRQEVEGARREGYLLAAAAAVVAAFATHWLAGRRA